MAGIREAGIDATIYLQNHAGKIVTPEQAATLWDAMNDKQREWLFSVVRWLKDGKQPPPSRSGMPRGGRDG